LNDFIKQNSKSITIGIISSMLFLYLFQPVLDFIGGAFLNLLSYTGSKFVDDFYAKIAHLELLDFSFYWIAIIFGTISLIAGVTSVRGFIKLFIVEKPSKNIIVNSNKKVYFSFYLMNLFIFIFTIVFLSTKIYQLRLITSFKQHMRIVAPYISEQIEEEIYSQWSLMNKEEDYMNVYIKLQTIALKNKLVLPRNKIYSLTTF